MPFIAKFQILNPIISALHIVYYLIFRGGGQGGDKRLQRQFGFYGDF